VSGSTKERGIGETAGFALARACKAHRASVGALLAPLGLHVGQEMVLNELWREDGLRGGEVAERLRVEPPTMTRTLRRLEGCGLLERRQDPEDARSSRFYLTQRARNLREPVSELWDRVEERTVAGLSEREREDLRRLLLKVRENLEEGREAGDCPASIR
jgi:DNA-binding MarR family transcriptional regulator